MVRDDSQVLASRFSRKSGCISPIDGQDDGPTMIETTVAFIGRSRDMRRFVLAVGAIAAIGGSAVTAAAYTAPSAPTPVAVLNVSPSMVSTPGDGPNTNCVVGPSTVTCTVRLTESAKSTEPLTWTAAAPEGHLVVYIPASGTLHPGQSVTVKATAICDRSAFMFYADARGLLENGVAVLFACG